MVGPDVGSAPQELVQQLRLRLAEQLKVPSGQVAMLCGVELLRDTQSLGSLPRSEGGRRAPYAARKDDGSRGRSGSVC
eukprot:Skav225679  [mRNA]  locus=scaffold1126:30255:31125:+ [translate_table: standard]